MKATTTPTYQEIEFTGTELYRAIATVMFADIAEMVMSAIPATEKHCKHDIAVAAMAFSELCETLGITPPAELHTFVSNDWFLTDRHLKA